MLRESDIDSLNNHLASLSRDNQRNHENLQGLLNQFKNLLDDYSALKSDYEEVKEGREKYKRQARGQERNPFVLVLVDGDGYIFKEHFLKAGSEGGVKAARELSDSVRELMHSTMGVQADSCRIMVRVYANILGLSKALARAGMVGHEARSISPFTSSFTRAQDLFDFVDSAEKKEGSDFKIRGTQRCLIALPGVNLMLIAVAEMFRLFVDLNQCRHIYFAGCHDTGFTSLLTPYRGSDRMTLIKAASFHRDFEALKLPIRELPSVFMSTPLAITKQTAPVCKHFQKGICKFGVGCNKQHVPSHQQLAKSADSDSSSPKPLWSSPAVVGRSQEVLAATLPTQNLKFEEYIPINKDGDRLDTYCPHPSPEAFAEYHRRAKRHRVCNSFHLSGECGDRGCQYDHSHVSNTIIEVLRYILLQHPCSRAGACRSIKCFWGHICQKPDCKAIKTLQCRFDHRTHTLDLQVAQWVASVENARANDDRDDQSIISSEAFQSQPPSD
ncbi:hypothetical protein N7513_003255 [Penicillium frequentans]|uniref:C3H1-type domain-containing protein n=1 Tax=Penicillium frequentans TaxID=3151616 RepID=A0AAD6CHL5_9EURO|nr:hypothetical protein N7494_013193 [Penicillium glabrum]KAJ5557669.1 hypothetical protein N7513_003255 [Penicillium glabrum]